MLVASPFPSSCHVWRGGRYSQVNYLLSTCDGGAEASQESLKCLLRPRIFGRLSKPNCCVPSEGHAADGRNKNVSAYPGQHRIHSPGVQRVTGSEHRCLHSKREIRRTQKHLDLTQKETLLSLCPILRNLVICFPDLH